MGAIVEKKTLELKKHVGLIHSTNKLSLLERKIANALLYYAYENLLNQEEHCIHIPSLCRLIGYDSKDYKTIKRSLVALISTVLEWNLIDKEKGKEDVGIWMASAILADAKIDGVMCTYSYSRRMRELCYYPEFYGRLNIQVLAQFKSTYGLALYENCIRYQNINQTPWFDLLTYRKLMGVEPGKYELFRDLNRRVIKPSIAEVNRYSPIIVKPEIQKQGRVVVRIRFIITQRVKNPQLPQSEQDLNDRLKEDYGLSPKQIEALVMEYDTAYIVEKIAIVESSLSYQNGKIQNLAKYLIKALSEDFQTPQSSRKTLEKLRVKKSEKLKLEQTHQHKQQLYRDYQNKNLPDIFEQLPKERKTGIEKDFHQYIRPTLYYGIYVKSGLKDPLVADRFGNFVRANYPELLVSLISFDEFT